MRVAVWGAGEIGSGLVYWLASSPYVSELHWINRSVERLRFRVVDLQHGFAFALTCRLVKATHNLARIALSPRVISLCSSLVCRFLWARHAPTFYARTWAFSTKS